MELIQISSLLICLNAKMMHHMQVKLLRTLTAKEGSENRQSELTAKKVLFQAATSHVLIDKKSM